MTSIQEMRLRNREVSILFMQQEHAKTLQDLHEEIRKLQQRCSDLQFKMAMEATYTSQEDEYKEKCESLEKEMLSQRRDIEEKQQDLEKKDSRIQNLEQQLRAAERKHKEELRQKSHVIGKLQADLLEKSDQIARLQVAPLTAQHHHGGAPSRVSADHASGGAGSSPGGRHAVDQYLDPGVVSDMAPSRALRWRGHPDHGLSRESSGSSQHSQEETDNPVFMPIPPSERPGSGGSRSGARSRRKMVTAQTVPHFAEVTARPASAKKLENYAPVDTEEILQIAREQRVTLKLPHRTGAVIPPIRASAVHASQPINPRQATSASFQQQKTRSRKTNAANVELETLAVDQVINSDLRKAQEFNSFGSDA